MSLALRQLAWGTVVGALGASAAAFFGGLALEQADMLEVSFPGLPAAQAALDWVDRNLGGSVLPFALVAAFYGVQLAGLRRDLAAPGTPPERIAQREHLIQVATGLFFGIGVLWTAIGMRAALLHALGDPGATGALGAAAVLERLVDGGILLSLTTTIVGGMGGYLMRVWTSITAGPALQAYYARLARQESEDLAAALARIEALLTRMAPETEHRDVRAP